MFTKFKLKQIFSAEVLHHRNHLGLTQSQLADAVSTSLRWIQRIESGAKLPSFFLAIRLILFLEIDANALISKLAENSSSYAPLDK